MKENNEDKQTQEAELRLSYSVDEYDETAANVQALQLAYADLPEEIHDTIEITSSKVSDDGYDIDLRAYIEISSQAWQFRVHQMG